MKKWKSYIKLVCFICSCLVCLRMLSTVFKVYVCRAITADSVIYYESQLLFKANILNNFWISSLNKVFFRYIKYINILEQMKGYGVNVHETKLQSIQGNTKQWNNAFIVVFHLEVTMRPSTKSKVFILILWQYNKLHNFTLLSYLFRFDSYAPSPS